MCRYPFIWLLLSLGLLTPVGSGSVAAADPASESGAAPAKARRVLYNLDGDSCLWTKKDGKQPVVVTADDLPTLVEEIAFAGSQVDTVLVCINAQATYYPTQVGDRRGNLSSLAQRAKWPAWEEQRFSNIEAMLARGQDPFALLLADARRRGLEALLTYRVNDIHDMEPLYCKLWLEHPEYRLPTAPAGSMFAWAGTRPGFDFAQQAVRDYTFRLIEEATQRYDCDGLELDFVRAPRLFQTGTEAGRIETINQLVERVRKMLDAEGARRGRRLVLAARVLSGLQECREAGLDPATWAKAGWIDFLTISPYSGTRYDLSAQPWKEQMAGVPIYGCADSAGSADNYRQAAEQFLARGADGVYLFNFFTPREVFVEPPYEVLKNLIDPQKLQKAR